MLTRYMSIISIVLLIVVSIATLYLNYEMRFLIEHARVLQVEVMRLDANAETLSNKLKLYHMISKNWNSGQDHDLDMMIGNLIKKGIITNTSPELGLKRRVIIIPKAPTLLDMDSIVPDKGL